MRSISQLETLHDCLVANLQIPDNTKQWLIDSLEHWLNGESLPDAFGIFDNSEERKQRRDLALKDYANTLDGSIWSKAGIIAKQVDLLRQHRKCNPIISTIDKINPIPESQRQIYNILKY
ncbi:hypothetical protein [Methylobacter sp. BlB1]|uniref:hypothetical protein n=1 Tax=Methylobacter sp. BlB1 TaxID=2785914 RepID=UPI0018932A25|nr:hypothetical protein [Methylobacter sp. BlB1]MBF6648949.1 hypothetical protein [Methylobacter sp. BlB1]